jgi:hypothetical protein
MTKTEHRFLLANYLNTIKSKDIIRLLLLDILQYKAEILKGVMKYHNITKSYAEEMLRANLVWSTSYLSNKE